MSNKKNQKIATKPIYQFFPSKKNAASASSNGFYEQHIPNPPSDVNNSITVAHDDEIEHLKEQIAKLTIENAKIKEENIKCKNDLAGLLKVHKEMCRMYVNKELKMKLLEKKIVPQEGILFDSFKNDLGEDVLINLRKLHGSKRSDSTFILQCMRKLYENDDQLDSVSACGNSKNGTMAKAKRDIIERIFLERLSSENLSDIDTSQRFIRLNRHINVAIANLRKEVNIFF